MKRSGYTFHADSMPEAAEVSQLAAIQCLKNIMTIETRKVRSMCLSGQTGTTLTHSAGIQSAVADVVPPNKKVEMLAAMKAAQPAAMSTDAYGHVIAQEVPAYFSPLRLIDDEKLSPLVFWKNHVDFYPNLVSGHCTDNVAVGL